MPTTVPTVSFNDQVLSNDLAGSLQGSVLFAQTSVMPSRATRVTGDFHPRLVALRSALVLFKPIGQPALPFVTLQVQDSQDAVIYSTCMSAPAALPPAAEGDAEVDGALLLYGEGFWSCRLPWQQVQPGIRLCFGSGNLSGNYDAPAVGAAGEMLLHSLDIGLLTPQRDVFASGFTEALHREYFQQTPCSRLVVNHYEPVHWKEVMLPDGTLYNERSPCAGPVGPQDGWLYQRIGRELLCLGINNANHGVHSSPGSGKSGLNNPNLTEQVTVLGLACRYDQSVVTHGPYGGSGVVVVSDCKGSELSRELGFNFGLGSAHTSFKNAVHAPAGSINSTWGWDSDRNLFIPNFAPRSTGLATCVGSECREPFHGHGFALDPMAGGSSQYPQINHYPLMTPYVLAFVQRRFDTKVVFDSTSATGYRKWSEQAKAMEEWAEFRYVEPDEVGEESMDALLGRFRLLEVSMYNGHYHRHTWIPAASSKNKGRGVHVVHQATFEGNVHVNGEVIKVTDGDVLNFESDGSTWQRVREFSFPVVRKPKQQGVPVTTIVGYYDPEGSLPDYFYPALHGGWGNVFDGDRTVETQRSACHVEVRNAKGQALKYLLRSERGVDGLMNRVHINVPQSFAATVVVLYRAGNLVLTRELQRPAGGARFTVNGRE